MLIPQEEALLDQQFLRTATCTSGGRFEVGSLRPGDYLALAFEHMDIDRLTEPTFIRNLTNAAVKLDLGHGERKTLDLQITPWPEN